MKWGRTVENIIDKIYAQMSSMSPSDQKVGRTILKNPATIINITISQLAKRAGVSDASIQDFVVIYPYLVFMS